MRIDAIGALEFAAEQDGKPIVIRVSFHLWEQLRTLAPLPATTEDMQDFALGEVEHRAALSSARRSEADGRDVIDIG